MMTRLIDVVDAMILALQPVADEIDGLQLVHVLNANPTPPSIDIYPATPFQTRRGEAFADDTTANFLVRARTTTADHEAGQLGLYRLLDKNDPASVQIALEADQSLGGLVQSIVVIEDSVTGFSEWIDDVQTGGRLIGCQWTVEVMI